MTRCMLNHSRLSDTNERRLHGRHPSSERARRPASGLKPSSSVDGPSLLLLWRRCGPGDEMTTAVFSCFPRCGRKTGCWHFSVFFLFVFLPPHAGIPPDAKQTAASDTGGNVDDIHGRVKREISSDFPLNNNQFF